MERLREEFVMGFGEINVVRIDESGLPVYNGDTVITPKPRMEQTLKTADTRLHSDITVLEIPYSEVSNTFGGKTATIG